MATYGETIRKHGLQLEQAEVSESDKLQASLALLDESLNRLKWPAVPGKALTANGSLKNGRFVGGRCSSRQLRREPDGLKSNTMQPRIRPGRRRRPWDQGRGERRWRHAAH